MVIMSVIISIADTRFPAHGGKMLQLFILACKLGASFATYFVLAAIFRMEEATFWINRFKSKLHI